MGDSPDNERDDEFFKEIYGKEYTGPPKTSIDKSIDDSKSGKRSQAGNESDDGEQERDPNAVPTDFTSREAKVWEAKSKAAERNWKRKKEEELVCKICGESGHYTQGCPTTLGAKRSREFVEKIPVKDKSIKPRIIGWGGSIIQNIEKDTGCKIRIDDNDGSGDASFIVNISGPDRLCLLRGTNAIKKIINEGEGDGKSDGKHDGKIHGTRQDRTDHSTSQRPHSRSRSPHSRSRYSNEDRHGAESPFSRTESRRKYDGGSSHGRSHSNFSSFSNKADRNSYQRFGRSMETSIHGGEKYATCPHAKDLEPEYRGKQSMYEGEKWTADSRLKELDTTLRTERRIYDAKSWVSDARGRESDPQYRNERGIYQEEKWRSDSHDKEIDHPGNRGENRRASKNLDDLELDFSKEALELLKVKSAQEDEENARHCEQMKEIRETCLKNMHLLRAKHAKEWEEFLRYHEIIMLQRQH
eukprot:TRINITY_DN20479_c0_g1_i2.p1 TRINITY_DN20479_c0_g1~~TRINITY_DN20479_c0_g1_i2.p1  ORF type:complete len:470 (+),score=111.35 TRINITY_DN20479_c0_g1_i2:278-1687(+)